MLCFTPKVWIFSGSENETLSAHGSSNLTEAGLYRNIEQIAVSTSWGSSDQQYTIDKLRDQFQSLWDNRDHNCIVLDLPNAVRNHLLTTYVSESPPKESELRLLYKRAEKHVAENPAEYDVSQSKFAIPTYLQYEEAPYAHQGKAVEAWCEAGFNGILEMATGSGKTITAMICAYRLFTTCKPLLIVVAAPYVPLIQQWCEEIEPFGLSPLNLSEMSGVSARAQELGRLRRQLRHGYVDVAAIVVTPQNAFI